jgi:hypothetical protein
MACRKCIGVNLCPCTIRTAKELMWLDVMANEFYRQDGVSSHPAIEPAPPRPRLWEKRADLLASA